jgi:DNA-binding NarL/FixJ family response regulator
MLGDTGQFERSTQLLHDSPWETARTELCWARHIRDSDPVASREHALRAHTLFQGAGARPWAAQARHLLTVANTVSTRQPPETVDRLEPLSERERTVALAVSRGLSNKAAAAELFISQKTVDAHLRQIYRKLGVRSRTQLAVVCYGEPSGATP